MVDIKKKRLIAAGSIFAALTLGVTIFTTDVGKEIFSFAYYNRGNNSQPMLTLNSSNKVNAPGDVEQRTAFDNKVTLTYYGNTSTTGHATLSSGGYITNKDHIRSIQSIKTTFNNASSLKLKVKYGGDAWSGETTIISGQTYDYSVAAPYYFQLTATSNVTISEVVITYSCIENSAAHEGEEPTEQTVYEKVTGPLSDYSGQYLIVYETDSVALDGTLSDPDVERNHVDVTISDNKIVATDALDNVSFTFAPDSSHAGSYFVTNSSGLYLYQYNGSNNNSNRVYIGYRSNSAYLAVSVDSNGNASVSWGTAAYLKFDNSETWHEFYFSSSSEMMDIQLYKRTSGEVGPSYDVPVSEIGFSAIDNNSSNYGESSVYDTDNALVVKANYDDGSDKVLTKGANGYSYVVKDSNDVAIDSSKAFTNQGNYTVIVSYKNYIPVEIPLTVTHLVTITSVTIDTNKVTYTTAEKLSDNYSTLFASILDSDGVTTSDIAYSDFASYGLTLSLINPNGVTSDPTVSFGVAGTWTIKLSYSETVYNTVQVTVNAIPVTSITIDNATLTIEEGKTGQLNASVLPVDATNQNYTWSSSDASIATVSATGLVTGVSVGTATISATASDGSGKVGECVVTVTEKTQAADEGLFTYLQSGDISVGDYVLIAYGTSGTAKVMSKTQNTNNRPAVDATVTNGTIERTSESSFAAFEVREGTTSGTLSFYDPNAEGYLYAASSSKNYLRTESTLTANSSFTVSNSGGDFSIVAQGSNTRNVLKYNNSADLFSCYAATGNQKLPNLYVKGGEVIYPTAISISGESAVSVGQNLSLSLNYTPANTTYKSITWTSSDDTIASVEAGLVTGRKAGTVTITATAVTENGTTSATKTITVSNVAVTGVSLSQNTASMVVGGNTLTLTPTVTPSNATNQNVTWTTSNNGVASVSNGVVTAIGEGSATITVTTADGNKTADCVVTVTENSGGSGGTSAEYTIDANTDGFDGSYTGSNGSHTIASDFSVTSNNVCIQSSKLQFKSSPAGSIYNTTASSIASITINGVEGTFVVYAGSSQNPTSGSITGSNNVYDLGGAEYFTVQSSGLAKATSIVISIGEVEPVDPTGITVTPSTLELAPGRSSSLSVSYSPAGVNQNKGVTWKSSNTSVATVDNSGNVTVSSSASIGQTATITATSTFNASFTSSCTVTVVEQQLDAWTIMIYMCGSDLESGSYRLASGDITEILGVSGQPDDVNIIIETGGAKSWASTHGISSSSLQRWHVENKKLVLDKSLTKASMGLTSTLTSFINWGLSEYPAQKTGLIYWNHGGAMMGCCYDENFDDDNLLNNERNSALSSAFSTQGRTVDNYSDKLEFIGYDCCLMQVQDIAEFDSHYARYGIASQESENGEGWDYDTWVDDLYAGKSTETILKAVVDGFIADNGGVNKTGSDYNQTLSYLDYSQMSAYKTAWENMASYLKNNVVTSSNKTSWISLIKGCKNFGDDDYTDNYMDFCIFDVKDFLNKLKANSTFYKGDMSSLVTAVESAFTNLVKYSVAQKGAGNAYGLCFWYNVSNSSSGMSDYYTSSQTNFTNWRSLCSSFYGS